MPAKRITQSARLDRIDARLDDVLTAIHRLEDTVSSHAERVTRVETRDTIQHDTLVEELRRIRDALQGVNERLDKQNGRVRKLELWRSEVSARSGVISAVVAAVMTIILTISGWLVKLKGG